MKIASLTIMVSLMCIVSISEANVCFVKGDPDKWIENYCLIKHKISKTKSKIIKECIEKENSGMVIGSCEGNIIYKEKICEILIKRNKYTGNINSCIKEEININELIKNV